MRARGSLLGRVYLVIFVTVESCVSGSTADVSWMVIGERQDTHMLNVSNMTDDNGKVIVEPDRIG